MATLRDQYAENTRQALFDTGLRLFGERDYAGLSAEELVRVAGLTRGALYHHFDGKRGLFEAVFEHFESQAAQRIRAAIDDVAEPFERIDRGVAEFLDVCADDVYRHVVLSQGPIALGWGRWRELDQRHLGVLVLDAVRDMLATARIKPYPAELIAGAFYGALTELALTVAESDDADEAREQARLLTRDMFAALTS